MTGTLSEATEDEQGNLSWLVDFKLDFLPDIDKEEDKEQDREQVREKDEDKDKDKEEEEDQPERKRVKRSVETVVVETEVSSLNTNTFTLIKGPSGPSGVGGVSGLYQSVKPPVLPRRQPSSAKPNYTYTDLITLALRDKTSLTVSEIYQWIR